MPRGFDQPETASLIEHLGIGVVPWRRRRRRLRGAIERLLHNRALRAAAINVRDRLGDDGGLATAAAIIRQLEA